MIIRDWSGPCDRVLQGAETSCGMAHVTVRLRDDYVPNTEATPGQVLALTYSDANITSFDLLQREPVVDLNFGALDGHDVAEGITAIWFTRADATWRFSAEMADPRCDHLFNSFCYYSAAGHGGAWQAVPQPSTVVLLGLACVVAWFARRRGC